MSTETPASDAADPAAADDAQVPATLGDRVLVVGFWLWAALLLLVTLAHLFGWGGVLDALDVKRWFGR